MLKRIKESDFFLTAKGKFVDTYELHSFGSGIVLGFMTGFTEGELRKGFAAMSILSLSGALGLELIRKKPTESSAGRAVRNTLAPSSLREQINKEGHYHAFGYGIGFVSGRLLRPNI